MHAYNEATTRNSDETTRVGRFLVDASSIRMGDCCGLWVRTRVYIRFQGAFRSTRHSANLNSPVIVVDAEITGGGGEGEVNEIWKKDGKRLRKHRSQRWVIIKYARAAFVGSSLVYVLCRLHVLPPRFYRKRTIHRARKGLKGLAWVALPSAERNKRASNWTGRRHGARIQWRRLD